MTNPTTLSYYVLDVFSHKKYEGNQLAVVLTPNDLPLSIYQDISREFGYAETSFLQYRDGLPYVRSFTPAGVEVHGSGHNLLGAACLVAIKDPGVYSRQTDGPYILMKDQRFNLSIQYENELPVIGMLQSPAEVLSTLPVESIAAALNLPPEDLALQGWQPSRVQTEVLHAMIPIKDVDTLRRIAPDKHALIRLSKELNFEGWYCFTVPQDGSSHVAETRFFNPLIGIEEDAATGSAAGPLAGFLHQQGLLAKDRDHQFLQGVVLQHPSHIHVLVEEKGIWVSGASVIVMEGRLFV